ncbi:polysaccharide pyruvyl transferase family protein [Parabacteroides sp. ZJ-118]|uniref:polysaccharide pyruvyl transferase family protein n=1 Tax=Parabacteroides sp. ZJ-118 TaxID=2709398 RepID=UPI0013EBCE32|nr:polysaccharide pyruvyl transferase family protein [Parabacteroides sp. ZJ-118]
MRYGLLVYPHNKSGIFNIGDYIQSIAAAQFLPQVNAYLNREHLNDNPGDDIALIANGWYMHNPENWPPHNRIHPLFVALHINKLAEKSMLSLESINYLKSHEPIGCRDYYTVENLKKHGVNAYFSGCLTLTLGETYKREYVDKEKIIFTDVNSHLARTPRFMVKCIMNLLFKRRILKQIANSMLEFGIQLQSSRLAAFYTTYSKIFKDEVLVQAHYKQHEIYDKFKSDKEKFDYADSLLKEYATAKYVVTSRIHCALPCLALNTPVLFVHNQNLGLVHNCRMNGLVELFHVIRIDGDSIKCDITNAKIGLDFNFCNKYDYKPIAKKMIKRCTDFIAKVSKQ